MPVESGYQAQRQLITFKFLHKKKAVEFSAAFFILPV
jgi:hypothetical protein